ncbi:MAG: amino acid ABC transporter substrate-binding protein [Anaerolineae bacterium]|nr:amino acid ABC transporter substrate-binding protein [Anaerolineae bacterium]
MKKLIVVLMSLVMLFTLVVPSAVAQDGGSLLDEVKDRGKLICGVNGGVPGFSFLDPDSGDMLGFDADFCRVVAAAIFGEVTADNLEFVQLTANERFTALQTGQVDVLFRNTTWTTTRDGDLGIDFGPTIFYDGQGLMVQADLGITSINELDGASICVLTGTTTALNISETMETLGFEYELVPFEESAQTAAAFEEGRCDVLTSDRSQLAGLRSNLADPSQGFILPDVISKEPLGPAYIEGDSTWGDVINWAVFATLTAEEMGINSGNIDEFLMDESTAVQRFLGVGDNASGSLLGLDNDFAVNIIREVGNYAEIFDRNIPPIGIQRGVNALWTDGGLMYPPAWR